MSMKLSLFLSKYILLYQVKIYRSHQTFFVLINIQTCPMPGQDCPGNFVHLSSDFRVQSEWDMTSFFVFPPFSPLASKWSTTLQLWPLGFFLHSHFAARSEGRRSSFDLFGSDLAGPDFSFLIFSALIITPWTWKDTTVIVAFVIIVTSHCFLTSSDFPEKRSLAVPITHSSPSLFCSTGGWSVLLMIVELPWHSGWKDLRECCWWTSPRGCCWYIWHAV